MPLSLELHNINMCVCGVYFGPPSVCAPAAHTLCCLRSAKYRYRSVEEQNTLFISSPRFKSYNTNHLLLYTLRLSFQPRRFQDSIKRRKKKSSTAKVVRFYFCEWNTNGNIYIYYEVFVYYTMRREYRFKEWHWARSFFFLPSMYRNGKINTTLCAYNSAQERSGEKRSMPISYYA